MHLARDRSWPLHQICYARHATREDGPTYQRQRAPKWSNGARGRHSSASSSGMRSCFSGSVRALLCRQSICSPGFRMRLSRHVGLRRLCHLGRRARAEIHRREVRPLPHEEEQAAEEGRRESDDDRPRGELRYVLNLPWIACPRLPHRLCRRHNVLRARAIAREHPCAETDPDQAQRPGQKGVQTVKRVLRSAILRKQVPATSWKCRSSRLASTGQRRPA